MPALKKDIDGRTAGIQIGNADSVDNLVNQLEMQLKSNRDMSSRSKHIAEESE